MVECRRVDLEVLREDLAWDMREPVGELEGRVLAEVAVIENLKGKCKFFKQVVD